MTSRHAHGLTTSHEFSISKGCSPWDALTKVSETQGREDPDPDAVIEKIATDGRRSAREKSVPSPQGRSLRKVCKGGSEEFVKCSVEILFDPIRALAYFRPTVQQARLAYIRFSQLQA